MIFKRSDIMRNYFFLTIVLCCCTLPLAMDKRGHQIFCDPLFTFFLPDNPHEKVEVCAKEDGQRSQGQEAREAPEKLDWQLLEPGSKSRKYL